MIKLPDKHLMRYKNIESKISNLSTSNEVKDYYNEIIDQYIELDKKYLFSQSFDKDFVFSQIDEKWPVRDRELFGMPFGVKDIFNTRVLPTEMGSEIWKGFKAGNNARVVDEIADAGGIIFSKTTTAEFAVHYIQAGRTLNPHNSDHITGTSSAGSAVAVACGALPVCLGTQTAGSIVRPASFCGVYGFKPSFGAFDRTGMLKTTDTLDTVGFLASDIYGLRKTFLASFQKETQYPYAPNYFNNLASFKNRKKLKVGIIAEQFSGYSQYDDYVKKDFEIAIKKLSTENIEFSVVENINFINNIHSLQDKIYCKSLSYYFKSEFKRGGGMSKVMSDMITMGNKISVEEYMDALKKQPEYRAKFDPIINSYDFLITPSTATVAPRISNGENNIQRQDEKDDTCLIWTFFGYPVLSIPAFWSEKHGLPFGLQIIAPKYGDLTLFNFGETVEELLQR